MFAIYATDTVPDDPLSALEIGEQPEPVARKGWLRVKISHASLNWHDLFTLRGITAHPEGISFPMILGNDGVGTLDDGTPVVIYPVLGSDDWRRDDETVDPHWNIFRRPFTPTAFHCETSSGTRRWRCSRSPRRGFRRTCSTAATKLGRCPWASSSPKP